MIRLGSLAGYPFEGPRVLAGWTVPAVPAVYAVMYKPDEDAESYAVTYVGHTEDLSAGAPAVPPPAVLVLGQAGRQQVAAARRVVRGAGRPGRAPKQIAEELCAVYRPGCNEQQFDRTWKDEWIGGYSAPTTGPLTTGREPPRAEPQPLRLGTKRGSSGADCASSTLGRADCPPAGPQTPTGHLLVRAVADALAEPRAAGAGRRAGRAAYGGLGSRGVTLVTICSAMP